MNMPSQNQQGTVSTDSVKTVNRNVILRTNNLCLYYGTKKAIEDISLEMAGRSITAIIGPSGSGKSSFLSCLNRLTDLNEECQVTGQVWLQDKEILSKSMEVLELRRRVGMLFQTPNPFPFSIWRNLELPLRHHGVRDKDIIANKIEKVLRDVWLWNEVNDRLDKSAQLLSGGQQQRLCLARTLILEPEVILMDEPCSALDPISSDHVEELITHMRSTHTVVVVTHNLAQAYRIADKVAFFWNQDHKGKGQLIEYGSVEQIFKHPHNELTTAYIATCRC
ncbi:MAG: phosphate ABC transporter ATP-binding protein [Pseudomonadota bacterium]